jgi:hypothetical protein
MLVTVAQAPAAMKEPILPDSCGNDKIQFDVKSDKKHAPPAPPADGMAMIVFVETIHETGSCFLCGKPTTRVGVDGKWVGANKGDSYFTVSVAPGEHHICTDWQSDFAKLRAMVGLTKFNAEAGKVYYYETKATMEQRNKGGGTEQMIGASDRDLDFKAIDEEEGKYRVKASVYSIATPAEPKE